MKNSRRLVSTILSLALLLCCCAQLRRPSIEVPVLSEFNHEILGQVSRLRESLQQEKRAEPDLALRRLARAAQELMKLNRTNTCCPTGFNVVTYAGSSFKLTSCVMLENQEGGATVPSISRRVFMQRTALVGAGLKLGLLSPDLARAATPKKMSIARYKSSPTEPEGVAEEAQRLTRRVIDDLGGMSRFVSKGDIVWVKPNIAWDRTPEQAANTNPDVVATIVKMCYEAQAKEVIVGDNPCNAQERTYPNSGIRQAAEKAGARVTYLDKRKFKKMSLKGKALKEWDMYTDMIEADTLINVPIAKHHRLAGATLGMKNLMGACGGQRSRFHQDLSNVLTDLAVFVKPELVVLDAIRVLPVHGPRGGNVEDVRRKDTLVAGVDQVAVDTLGATLLGTEPNTIGHIVEAQQRGLGTMDYKSFSPVESLV